MMVWMAKNLLRGNSWVFRKSRLEAAIWGVQLLLVAAAIISTFLLFTLVAIPYSLSTLPALWFSIRSCLSPPYIYLILNFIIIFIAASSTTFQHHHHHQDSDSDSDSPPEQNNTNHFQNQEETPPPPPTNTLSSSTTTVRPVDSLPEIMLMRSSSKVVSGSCLTVTDESSAAGNKSPSASPPCLATVAAGPTENPQIKLKLAGHHIQHLFVAESTKDEEEDTLEATWKAIRQPRTRHLTKSETWDVHKPPAAVDCRELRKSETFNDVSGRQQRRGPRRRDATFMTHDELNRRVEAFIHKFNNDMRLQRQESDQRFTDMINRGV